MQSHLFTKAQRQQALADMLAQKAIQGNMPVQTGTVAPQIGIGHGLTQLASAMLSKRQSGKADDLMGQAREERSRMMAEALAGNPEAGNLQGMIDAGVDPAIVGEMAQRGRPATPKQEKLVSILGDDGEPIYVPESQAIGKTPHKVSAVTVNNNPSGMPRPPSGYHYEQGEGGEPVLVATPGGPASNKAAEKTETTEKAVQTYLAGREALMTGLSGANTNPLSALFPAMTEAQQQAQGGVSAMAPVLKQIFRSAGEGIFTDKDQELLLGMIPDRGDFPGVRESKMQAVDAIVSAKLGVEPFVPWGSADSPAEEAPAELPQIPVIDGVPDFSNLSDEQLMEYAKRAPGGR